MLVVRLFTRILLEAEYQMSILLLTAHNESTDHEIAYRKNNTVHLKIYWFIQTLRA